MPKLKLDICCSQPSQALLHSIRPQVEKTAARDNLLTLVDAEVEQSGAASASRLRQTFVSAAAHCCADSNVQRPTLNSIQLIAGETGINILCLLAASRFAMEASKAVDVWCVVYDLKSKDSGMTTLWDTSCMRSALGQDTPRPLLFKSLGKQKIDKC